MLCCKLNIWGFTSAALVLVWHRDESTKVSVELSIAARCPSRAEIDDDGFDKFWVNAAGASSAPSGATAAVFPFPCEEKEPDLSSRSNSSCTFFRFSLFGGPDPLQSFGWRPSSSLELESTASVEGTSSHRLFNPEDDAVEALEIKRKKKTIIICLSNKQSLKFPHLKDDQFQIASLN